MKSNSTPLRGRKNDNASGTGKTPQAPKQTPKTPRPAAK